MQEQTCERDVKELILTIVLLKNNPHSSTYTGCPKKNPKTIENDLLLEFQCLALN